jgi:uncharacterized membrane protein required for colicin V production
MNIMPFVILIAMFFLGTNGRNRGVVNYKFTMETIVLTIIIMPKLAVFGKDKLMPFMPEMLAAIITLIFSLIIVFLTVNFLLTKIAKIPEYEYTPTDRMLGFFVGAFKGFCLMSLVIMLYGITFADIVLPETVNRNFKNNFSNSLSKNSTEYYRESIYGVYARTKGAGVEDLYGGKSVERKATDLSGYKPWNSSSGIPESVDKKGIEDKK